MLWLHQIVFRHETHWQLCWSPTHTRWLAPLERWGWTPGVLKNKHSTHTLCRDSASSRSCSRQRVPPSGRAAPSSVSG